MNKLTFKALAALTIACTVISGCKKEDDNSISMDDVSKGIEMIKGADGREYEAVDLGLPSHTLWATCNLGASSPQKNGNYYAWGETSAKTNYDWTNYSFCQGDRFTFTKYIRNDKVTAIGYDVDNRTELDSIDDAASVIMGGKWRTPSKANVSELLLRTTHKFCTLKGVTGFLLTSNVKGYEDRSIFIPLSGKIDLTVNNFEGRYGFYWIRELYTADYQGKVLWLENKDGQENIVSGEFAERYIGLTIRPVTKR